tara:strand:+ start:218 stop:418 length:201 start_codon:yes stop_codon:yes gene_type:complete
MIEFLVENKNTRHYLVFLHILFDQPLTCYLKMEAVVDAKTKAKLFCNEFGFAAGRLNVLRKVGRKI